jgi:hypothetical protein
MTASDNSVDESDSSTGLREVLKAGEKHPAAMAHLKLQRGGRWWRQADDAESPAWYDYETQTVQDGTLPPEHRPDVPADVDWSNYCAYKCRHRSCSDDCINPVGSVYARVKACRTCFLERDVDYSNQNNKIQMAHLPDDVEPITPHRRAR